MQRLTRTGLDAWRGDGGAERRCVVRTIHNASPLMGEFLFSLWESKTVGEAIEILARPDVMVTNQKDKDSQLLKIRRNHERLPGADVVDHTPPDATSDGQGHLNFQKGDGGGGSSGDSDCRQRPDLVGAPHTTVILHPTNAPATTLPAPLSAGKFSDKTSNATDLMPMAKSLDA